MNAEEILKAAGLNIAELTGDDLQTILDYYKQTNAMETTGEFEIQSSAE